MAEQEGALFPQDHFTRGYDVAEPRAYFRSLEPLGYRQPAVVAGYLARYSAAIAAFRGKSRLRVLDFACGYGAVAMVLRHEVTLDELYRRFAEDVEGDPLGADRSFFAARRRQKLELEIGGLDIAGSAVAYARTCGLIDHGFAEDLTEGEPGESLAAFMAETDIVVETGAVYPSILACYRRLIEAAGAKAPWLLFGPRGDADTRALWHMLEAHGYRIEVCSARRRRYRRFLHAGERADAERLMRAAGRDPADFVEDGWLVNDLVLARPEAHAVALPVEELRF